MMTLEIVRQGPSQILSTCVETDMARMILCQKDSVMELSISRRKPFFQ